MADLDSSSAEGAVDPAARPEPGLWFDGADGTRLAADAWGYPDAPTVVMLHGGGQTRHAWGGTGAALARSGFRAISIDMRGHGDSDRAPGGDYRLDRFVDDLLAVMDAVGGRPALVGASLGGLTGLVAEGEAPEHRASALVMVDAAARIELVGAARIRAFMTARPDGFSSLEEVASAIAEYQPHRPPPDDLSGLTKNLRLGEDGRWRWHWDPALMDGPHRLSGALDLERLRGAARRISIPTLLVRGRLSDVISEEGANEFLELVPHAEFTDISDAGHMVAGDRNDVFTAAVVDFLTGVLPAGEE